MVPQTIRLLQDNSELPAERRYVESGDRFAVDENAPMLKHFESKKKSK
jgi:hypothetical protein